MNNKIIIGLLATALVVLQSSAMEKKGTFTAFEKSIIGKIVPEDVMAEVDFNAEVGPDVGQLVVVRRTDGSYRYGVVSLDGVLVDFEKGRGVMKGWGEKGQLKVGKIPSSPYLNSSPLQALINANDRRIEKLRQKIEELEQHK